MTSGLLALDHLSTLVDYAAFFSFIWPMIQASSAKDRLFFHAQRQFWERGYSNVSVRQIATAANADIALISRYYGSKLGLFEATLDGAFDVFDPLPETAEACVDALVEIFVSAPRQSADPSAVQMLLSNSNDSEVGALVRRLFDERFQAPLGQRIGSEQKAALLMSVAFGISIAEKSLRMRGIAGPHSELYASQLRHLLNAALTAPIVS